MQRLRTSAFLPIIIGISIIALISRFAGRLFTPTRELELGLLTALILAEFYMLYKMEHERRERLSLVRDLDATRKALGREKYLALIKDGIEQSQTEVLFTTRSMENPEKEPLMDSVIQASAKKRGPNFSHRGIVAPRNETIAGAYQLIDKAGIDIRFHDYYNSSTLRFVIIDRRKTILGIGKPEERSETSYMINSYTLAKALAGEFERLWDEDKAMTFPQYVRKATEALSGLPNSEKASRLGIPEAIVDNPEEFLEKQERK